jgi:hypothetical protein
VSSSRLEQERRVADLLGIYRPKIQRLVTPLRLQRRRHLRALKIRRLEHQKEQKAEYECVSSPFRLPIKPNFSILVPSLQNELQRRRRKLLRSKHHTRSVSLSALISPVLKAHV